MVNSFRNLTVYKRKFLMFLNKQSKDIEQLLTNMIQDQEK